MASKICGVFRDGKCTRNELYFTVRTTRNGKAKFNDKLTEILIHIYARTPHLAIIPALRILATTVIKPRKLDIASDNKTKGDALGAHLAEEDIGPTHDCHFCLPWREIRSQVTSLNPSFSNKFPYDQAMCEFTEVP